MLLHGTVRHCAALCGTLRSDRLRRARLYVRRGWVYEAEGHTQKSLALGFLP